MQFGHSARDTFEMLYEKNVNMESKNFSVGVRIEHKQDMINKSQYGTKTKLKLPPADYKLAYHAIDGRSCYTFCMCPGGFVMPSSSEENTIVTNGMSNFSRDGKNAMIRWLYEHQSQQGRKHYKNRLFIICDGNNPEENLKLKSDFDQIRTKIKNYIDSTKEGFNKLIVFDHGKPIAVTSDIIYISCKGIQGYIIQRSC